MGELYFIISSIAILVTLTVWSFWKKMKIAGSFFLSVGLVLAIHEIAGKLLVDRTVSQEVWIISTWGWSGWIYCGLAVLLMVNVAVHFAWKNITGQVDYWKRKLGKEDE